MMTTMPIRQRHVLIPFFVSGFTALVFEVVWARQACLIFGNTTLASAAVIAAFMTGLAAGSYLFGKVADRRPERALMLYGILEAGIGVFALVFPLLLHILVPVYKAIYLSFYQDFFTISLIRFFMSFLILAVPTICMGGTLPLLSRFLSGTGESMNKNVNALYAVNLLGATTGSFVSGFFLVAVLGLWKTSLAAALMNLLLAVYVTSVFRKQSAAGGNPSAAQPSDVPVPEDSRPEISKFDVNLIMGLMFVHGFAAFVIQICWTRTMSLVLGSSTYAFSAMLTTFLAGLGLGTAIVRWAARRNIRFTLAGIGYFEMAAGLSVVAFIPVFEWAVYYFVKLYPYVTGSFRWTLATQFLLCSMTMIVPTALIGILFPAVLYYLGRPRDIGKIVGRTYAVNTLGGVLGAFTAAFVFIGQFGVNGSLRLASLLSIAAGAAVTLAASKAALGTHLRRVLVLAFLSSLFFFYEWDRNMFSSGVFMYAEGYMQTAQLGKKAFQKVMREGQKLLFYKDGVSTTVTVFAHERAQNVDGIPAKSLRVNGKVDASTIGDMSTQLYCGFLPLFARPDAEDVLVIGLGSGVTLGSVLQFPSVKSAELVEIESAVIEANRYFEVENHYALKDPRVKLIVGDGRNHISFSPKSYDVIISVPSNPWISGVSSLFTKENYELALRKLNPRGVYCQWFHSYQMSKDDFIMIMKTFASTFPEISLFQIGADYLLLGSRDKIVFDYDKMSEILAKKSLQSDLKYFGDYEALFLEGHFAVSGRDFRKALDREVSPLNTDDHLRLEYNAPKHLYENTSRSITDWVAAIPRTDLQPDFTGWSPEKMRAQPGAWKYFYNKAEEAAQGGRYEDALKLYREAAALNVDMKEVFFRMGNTLEALHRYNEAIEAYEKLTGDKEWEIRYGCAVRRAKIRKKLEENPILERKVEAHNLIASLSYYMGDRDEALRSIDVAIHLDPYYLKNYEDMVVYYSAGGREELARKLLEKAERLYGDKPLEKARTNLQRIDRNMAVYERIKSARFLITHGKFEEARNILMPLTDDMDDPTLYDVLADSEEGLGDHESAREHRMIAIAGRHAREESKEIGPLPETAAQPLPPGEAANPEAAAS